MSRDKAKRAGIAIVAAASLAWSLWVLSLTVSALLQSGIHRTGSFEWFRFFFNRLIAIVMFGLSVRGFRLAAGIDSLQQSRVKLWRVFTGVVIVVSAFTLMFVPSSRKYLADNESGLIEMYVVWILLIWLGAWLICSAFPRKPQNLTEGVPQP
jgi:hypothetical protein